MHVVAGEPFALNLDVGVGILELGDKRVVPIALLAGRALDPIVVADDDALAGGGRLGRRLWRGCRSRGPGGGGGGRGGRWGTGRRGGSRGTGRRRGRRWRGSAACGQDGRPRNAAKH